MKHFQPIFGSFNTNCISYIIATERGTFIQTKKIELFYIRSSVQNSIHVVPFFKLQNIFVSICFAGKPVNMSIYSALRLR